VNNVFMLVIVVMILMSVIMIVDGIRGGHAHKYRMCEFIMIVVIIIVNTHVTCAYHSGLNGRDDSECGHNFGGRPQYTDGLERKLMLMVSW
jgi:hypothetical protein